VILLHAMDTQVQARILRDKTLWLRDDAQAVLARTKRALAQARRALRSKTPKQRDRTSRRAA